MTAHAASLVLAIEDPARLDGGAVALARLLVAGTAIATDVVTLPRDGDRRDVLVERVVGRDGDLVVTDVHGGGYAGDRLMDEDAEMLFDRAPMPVLARGPAAAAPVRPRTLVVALDGSADLTVAVGVAATWRVSFAPLDVAVVTLQAPSGWPPARGTGDTRLAGVLQDAGLDATVDVIDATEPAADLAALAGHHPDPVLLVAARRWPGHDHWFSTARQLIRRAPFPVLVAPVSR